MQKLLGTKYGYKQTDLGLIPNQWNVIKLDEIGVLRSGGTPSRFKKGYWENGTIPWLSSGEVRNNIITTSDEKITELGLSESAAKLFPKGTVLIAITGQGLTRGRTALLGIDSTTNQSIIGINHKKNIVNNIFLWYYLQHQYWKLRSISQGSNQAGLNLGILGSFRIHLPPIQEQKIIATILSKVDELIQKTDQIIEQTQRLKKGLMQKLLTKGIGHSSFKKTDAGQIPEEWQVMELGKVLNMCQYGLSLKLSERGQYPTFRMNNIESGYMVANKMKFLNLDKTIFERYKLEKGDLLFNRTNSSDLVGKIGLFTLDGDYTFASYLIRLRPNRETINSFFLNYYLNTDFMQYKLKSLATPGVSQVNINAENLKSISISIPTLTEQEKIVFILQKMDEQKYMESGMKDNLSNLKKGLMQNLLTGKIRVKV